MDKIERDLTEEEADKILEYYKGKHEVLYVIFALLFKGGLRRGEVVGTREGTFHRQSGRQSNLPGLQVEDVRDGGVWVHGKGGYFMFQGLPRWVYDLLKQHIKGREKGRIFDYHPDGIWRSIRKAAKAVGIQDWENIHPHLTRHFFGTRMARETGRDPWKVGDMMRHRSLASSRRYVQKLGPDEKKELAELA